MMYLFCVVFVVVMCCIAVFCALVLYSVECFMMHHVSLYGTVFLNFVPSFCIVHAVVLLCCTVFIAYGGILLSTSCKISYIDM